jgi:hypothetical protein
VSRRPVMNCCAVGKARSRFVPAASLRRFVASALLCGIARPALACPVCFGNSDAPMAIATNNGVLFMLAIVVAMLGAFASFFIYLIRRANRVAEGSRPAADAAGVTPSEGTAQC